MCVCVYEHTLTHIFITNHEGHFEGCSTEVKDCFINSSESLKMEKLELWMNIWVCLKMRFGLGSNIIIIGSNSKVP